MSQSMRARCARRFVAAVLSLGLLWPAMSMAAPSAYCPTLSMTVAKGSSATLDVSNCDGPSDFGMTEPLPDFGASHGSVTLSGTVGGVETVTYAHNNDSATSDTFTMEDEDGNTVTVNVTITAGSSITVTPASLPDPATGVAYSQTLASSGGTAPYTYTVSGGALPSGLSLSTTGVISGTPSERGVYNVNVTSQDSLGTTAVKGYTGTVANPTLSMTPNSGSGYQGTPYTTTLVASGGIAPYTYTIDTGSLPTGMALSTTGVISGTPTSAPGPYTANVRVTDSSTGPGTYFEVETFAFTLLPPPSVTITVAPGSANEDGATNLVYTVTRSVDTGAATVVNLGWTGTATAATDYTGHVATVTIPAGALTATVTIDPVADAVVEANETVIGTVLAGTAYTVGTPSSATGTLTNDDFPAVTSVSPSAGPLVGGTSVVITGSSFTGATTVSFGGTAASFTVNSATQITATAPAHAAGTVDVTVTVAGQTSATSAADQYTYVAAPAVTSISPTSGPSTGGTMVVITGTNLNGATAVTFGGASAIGFTVNSASQITATSPAGVGTVDVRVTTVGGTSATSAADQYTFVAAPTVTSISPTAGPTAGGTTVVVTGTNLSGATAVTFGGVSASGFTVNSATQITATAPAGTGTVDVRVTTGGGTSATSAADQYTYVAAPTVTSLSPTAGPTAGGTTVVITGTALNGATSVRFGATTASFTINSATQITATAPANAAGTYDVTVTTVGGTSATSAADQYTYVAAPTVTAISPSNGPSTGGTTVTITGASFGSTSAVTFGGVPATGFTVNSASQITATAPAGAGTVDVRVTTIGGTSATSAADQFTYVAAPTVTSISPTAGPTAGGTTVVLTGTNLTGATAVTFGGTPASGYTVNSATQISATAPAGAAGTVDVRVTTVGGTSAISAADQYTYVAAPTVSSISPASGPTAGGTTVTITGTNLAGAVAVTFGGSSATAYTVNSATQISATSPAGAAGTVDVRVSTVGGTSATSGADQYTYVATPIAAAVSATVAFGSTGNPVTLALSGGTATSVAIATPPTHGTASVSGTSITYTPATGYAGPDSFTYTASNTGGTSAPATATITVGAPVISVTASGPSGATVGASYTQTFTWSGGTAPYSAFAVTGLPAGVSIAASTADSVTLSGTPTQAGTFTVNAQATDSSSGTGPYVVGQNFPLTVAAPTLSLTPAAGSLTAPYGIAYSQVFNASGGVGPYQYAVASGTLPAGLTLDASSGALSGTPTAPGTYVVTISATDAGSTGTGAPFSISRSYTIQVAAPVLAITPATLPGGTAASAYLQSLSASGGVAPYSYALTAGTLPPGLSLSTLGQLSGTPTAAGTFNAGITATDANGQSTTQTYAIAITAPTLTLAPNTVAVGTAGTAYSQVFAVSGGTAPYTAQLTGALPAGMSFDTATRTLSGTPTESGSFGFDIAAQDSTSGTAGSTSVHYTLVIAAPTVTLTPASVTPGTAGTAYAQTFAATGGIAPYTLQLTGTLPTGLTFDAASGTLSGTPTQSGTFGFDVAAHDSTAGAAATATLHYTLTVVAPTLTLTPATVPSGTAGTAYSQTFTAGGGIAPYTAQLTGTLPTGMTFDAATGTLSGTPTQSGSFDFDVAMHDSTAGTAGAVSNHYTLTIAAPALTLTPATIPSGTAGTAYSQAFTASGGIAPYTATLTGTLPTGMTFDAATRTLAGTPTQSGTFAFDVTVHDSTSGTAGAVVAHYTLTIAAPALTLTPTTVPTGTAGTAYSQTFAAAGGIAPYTYAIAGGALPAGLALNATTGALSGTPTVAGTFNFSVLATDSTGGTAASTTVAYTLTLSAPTITITPATLHAAIASTAYSEALSATGGTAPYRFTVTAGALPTGVTLSQAGALAGTPTADGSFAFTISATDALGFTASRAYTFAVATRPDPTHDAEVRGLLDGQAQATHRFASAQIDNFQSRMESLHGQGAHSGVHNGLTFMDSAHCMTDAPRDASLDCGPSVERTGIGAADAGGSDETATGSVPSSTGAGSGIGVWLGGAIRSGNADGRQGAAGLDFETDGVSIGADTRVSANLVLGGGLGYGRDATDVGTHDSRIKGESWALVGYASYSLGNAFFVDSLVGYERLSYDLRRHVTVNGATVRGSRDGAQWFASVSTGADLMRGGWQFTPYGRVDIARAELDAYAETGDAIYALDYGKQTVDSTTGNLGLRLQTRRATEWGGFSPQFRVEYQHDFQGDGEATMRYVDLPSAPLYSTRVAGFDRSRYMLGAGAAFVLHDDFSIRLEYRGLFGTGGDRDNALQLQFQKSY